MLRAFRTGGPGRGTSSPGALLLPQQDSSDEIVVPFVCRSCRIIQLERSSRPPEERSSPDDDHDQDDPGSGYDRIPNSGAPCSEHAGNTRNLPDIRGANSLRVGGAVPHRIPYYLDGRLFEWTFSIASFIFGIGLLAMPGMARGSIIRLLVNIVGWPAVGIIFLLVGSASVTALTVNGHSWAIGPRVRSVCAILRSVLWGEFALSMARVSYEEGHLSPMVIFFSIFTLSELYVVYRAVLDVRIRTK